MFKSMIAAKASLEALEDDEVKTAEAGEGEGEGDTSSDTIEIEQVGDDEGGASGEAGEAGEGDVEVAEDDVADADAPSLEEAMLGLLDVPDAGSAMESYGETLDHLEALRGAIATEGLSPALVAFADREGLLSSTILTFPSLEQVQLAGTYSTLKANSDEAKAALEGIVDTVKETVTGWAQAAWGAVTSMVEKATNLIKAGWNKVAEFGAYVKGKVYDAARAAKEVISAHPIATTVAALAALTAIGTVVTAVVWPTAIPGTAAAVSSYIAKAGTKIRSIVIPNRSVGALDPKTGLYKVNKNAMAKGIDAAKAAGKGVQKKTAAALGYTKDKVQSLYNSAKGVFKEGGSLRTMLATVKARGKSIVEAAKKFGGEKLKAARDFVKWAWNQTWELVKGAGGWCLSIVTGAFGAIKRFFTGGVAAAKAGAAAA